MFSILPYGAREVKSTAANIASQLFWVLVPSPESILSLLGQPQELPATQAWFIQYLQLIFFSYLNSIPAKDHVVGFLPQFQSFEVFLNSESSALCVTSSLVLHELDKDVFIQLKYLTRPFSGGSHPLVDSADPVAKHFLSIESSTIFQSRLLVREKGKSCVLKNLVKIN